MILNAHSGIRGTVWDIDTGKQVRKVIWLDTDNGMLEAYRVDKDADNCSIMRDINGEYLTYQAKGNFKFVPIAKSDKRNGSTTNLLGADKCIKCGSWLTLPGHELCANCNQQDKGYKPFIGAKRLLSPILTVGCDHKGCNNPIAFMVGDEVAASPQLAQRRLWDRGACVGQRFYCYKHWQPPRLLDAKGEVVEELQEIGARPK